MKKLTVQEAAALTPLQDTVGDVPIAAPTFTGSQTGTEPKAPFADCGNCPLKDEPFVPGFGPDKAKICVVGEAPGQTEVNQGKPFIGRSGKMFNDILKQHGLNREDIYVTNACLCRPVNNKTPTAKAIKACRPRLMAELLDHEPETIVTLGSVPAKAILNTKVGVSQLRSVSDHRSEEIDCVVIPTFHPAYALRNPDIHPFIVSDLSRLVSKVEVRWEPTKWIAVERTDQAIRTLARQVESSPILTLDVEVHYERGQPNDPHTAKLLCMGISHRPGAAVVYSAEVCSDRRFQRALDYAFSGSTRWGFQRGQFDIQRLWTNDVPGASVSDDTLLLHYAQDERVGTHGLEQMAGEILYAPTYKQDARKWLPYEGASLSHLPKSVLYEYNATDTDVTHRLIEPLRERVAGDGCLDLYESLLVPAVNALARVEYRGVPVDAERLAALSAELEIDLSRRRASIEERWLLNPGSPKQVKASLTELMEFDYELESTNKMHLEDMIEALGIDAEASEAAREILEYRKIHKMYGTYAKGFTKRMVRNMIYASFNINNTATGRLSSSNPNMQNVPKTQEGRANFRDIVMAPEDWVILSADYAAIELRYLAHLIHDPYLTQAFKDGRNIHLETTHAIWGSHVGKGDKRYVWAKNIRFGSIYEGRYFYLANLYDVPENVVKRIQDEMHAQSPGIKEWWRSTEEETLKNRYLRTERGRLRRFWYITDDNWEDVKKQAVNFRPQSMASDFTLESLVILDKLNRDYYYPFITIHDDLTFLCHKDYVHDAAREIRSVMESVPKLSVPTPVEFSIGKRWGSMSGFDPDQATLFGVS